MPGPLHGHFLVIGRGRRHKYHLRMYDSGRQHYRTDNFGEQRQKLSFHPETFK
jgi:hypothetical protein